MAGTQEKLGVDIITIIDVILLKHTDFVLPCAETWVVVLLLGSSLRQKEALNPFPGETKI